MPQNNSGKHKGKRTHSAIDHGKSARGSMVSALAAGGGMGALIGLAAGWLLAPRRSGTAEPGQSIAAWREVARRLSEELHVSG